MQLKVVIQDAPRECAEHGPIRLALTHKKQGDLFSDDFTWTIEVEKKPNRAGELVWTGDCVQHHGDGRRFVYFAWYAGGRMFRRIKLYLDSIPEGATEVHIQGRMKDGTPACSTAKLI